MTAASGMKYTSGMVAMALGGELVGRPDLPISDFAGLDQAQAEALTFIRAPQFAARWASSKATTAIVSRGINVEGHDPAARALIIVDNADFAIAKLLSIVSQQMPEHRPQPGVHPTAIIDPTAKLGANVLIGAQCIVGPRCVIADNAVLHPRVTLGADVRIGAGAVIHPGVVIYDRCVIGDRNLLHANVTIGADGFGFLPDRATKSHIKVPHIGNVVTGNDVEIGANSCVDKGKFGATFIDDQVKIDNLCQIGHNVKLGRAAIVCGACAIGGSTVIGEGAVLAGKVGIIDNLKIGAGAQIGAGSGVMNDIGVGEIWFGFPAMRQPEAAKNLAGVRRLADLIKTVRRVEKALAKAGIKIDPPDPENRLPGRR